MDMSQYRDLFVAESKEHINAFNELIMHIEDAGTDQAALDELFRHAHSLKGMAATMGYTPIAKLAHAMEDQLSRVRSGQIHLARLLADLLLESSDALNGMVAQIEAGLETLEECSTLQERVLSYTPDTGQESSVPDQEPPHPDEAGPAAAPRTQHQFRQSDSLKSIRIKTETLDHLVNIAGELITNRHRLQECAERIGDSALSDALHQTTALLRNLRDEVLKARMLPFSFIAERFPRLVRDLARSLGKEIAFSMEGREIELDRGILEEITEPLIHILRNAVDHGMELPAERSAAGKSPQGEIGIAVTRDKDCVEITVSDDGRGMDARRLVEKAIAKGVIDSARGNALQPHEAYMLVCEPGFSTAETVSDISGRGVGMDAVRTAVHSLGGTLRIDSQPGHGSRFTLRLPISVSIIHALIARCGKLDIALPLNAISRTLELRRDDIVDEDGRKVVHIDELSVPVFSMNRLLSQPLPPNGAGALAPAVVSASAGRPAAFITDRLQGQQEIFVKPLAPPLSSLRGISGGTVCGDGRIMFVVDIGALC